MSYEPFKSGATLPSSAEQGQQFLHTPTGRKILMQYDGTNWIPVYAFGSTTLYVDGTSGVNDQDNGHATGASAYNTIQYALDEVPPIYSGNVVINIAAGTYSENVVIDGKVPTGNYTLKLTATLTTLDSLTAASGVQGTGATRATVTRDAGSWTTDQRANKLLRFTAGNNNGVTLVIDSNTTTVATMVGTWDGTISTDTFVVENWGVTIDGSTTSFGVHIKQGVKAVILENLKIITQGSAIDNRAVNFEGIYCQIDKCWLENACDNRGQGQLDLIRTYVSDVSGGRSQQVFTNGGGRTRFDKAKSEFTTITNGSLLRCDGSLINFSQGSVLQGGGGGSVKGLHVALNGRAQCFSADADGHTYIDGCNDGIEATGNGIVAWASDIAFGTNTTNATPAVGANTENPLVNSS